MGTISIPAGLTDGQTAFAEHVTPLYNLVNGGLDDGNMKTGGVDGKVLKAGSVQGSALASATLALIGSIVLSGSTAASTGTSVAIQSGASAHRYYLGSLYLTVDGGTAVRTVQGTHTYYVAAAATEFGTGANIGAPWFIRRSSFPTGSAESDSLSFQTEGAALTFNYSIYQLTGSEAPPWQFDYPGQHVIPPELTRYFVHCDPAGKVLTYSEIQYSHFLYVEKGDPNHLIQPTGVAQTACLELLRRPEWAENESQVLTFGRVLFDRGGPVRLEYVKNP